MIVHLLLFCFFFFNRCFFRIWMEEGAPSSAPHPFAKTFFHVISVSQPFRFAEHFHGIKMLVIDTFTILFDESIGSRSH